ncbi:hypothetical protein FGO68_gene15768 [Halteria grandinella]|uniref:dual-specificity kinase n=1 Tax=Halteria grandinella TaxID=5974 RepID=A0A8J8T8Z3_HALGN|nr:hypothetical protein FGO68_gene15768 [Halteria grandinella]
MLGTSQSSSSQGPPNNNVGGVNGIHPNHFYQQTNTNNRVEYNQSGMSTNNGQQQYNTNTSNFNSLDYSDVANSSRRAYNESSQQQSANVKRNNFLNLLNGGANHIEEGVKSPESSSQPNPPTLRKITLNQRILQKNMNRISNTNNVQAMQAQEPVQEAHQPAFAGGVPIRHKKFQSANNKLQINSNSQQRDNSMTSSTTSDQQPMINVARIQQAIQKIYGNQRKNSLNNSQQQAMQPGSQQFAPNFTNGQQFVGSSTQTIEAQSEVPGQIKRKQIKIKPAFGGQQMGSSADTQPTNASTEKSACHVPQLNFSSESTGAPTQQSATSPLNKKLIHQGQIASSSRRQMRETQRSKINNTHQDTARVQEEQEVTNRSHLATGNVTMSEPVVITDQTLLASHRQTSNSQNLVSARHVHDRESQLRQAATSNLKHQTSSDSIGAQNDIQYPLNPQKAIKHFRQYLTAYEIQEVLDFPQIYYVGVGCQKVKGNQSADHNCGYDDAKGNYKIIINDQIGYRYEIREFLGKGSFGIAVKCFDHKKKEYVAIKVIKNKKKYYYQAGVELKILQFLRENDQDDTMNIIHMKDYVIFRKHLCISFELMSINLYDFLKLNDFEGLSLSLIRRFAIQLLYALKYLKEHDVIHCDLKPENILLKDPTKSGIKIIDFGSSCFQDERVYTYIQSRFYRAPEIILGIPYTPAIDMWSFGCIMAEFCIGYPLFPGEDEMEQFSMIMEFCGVPNQQVVTASQRRKKFFNDDGTPILAPNQKNKVRKPASKNLEEVLDTDDRSFVDFVRRCLDWDPETRMSPDEALRHAWILEGLPPKVLIHHQKLHNIPTSELPPHIREQRQQYFLKEQQANQQLNMTQQMPQQQPHQPQQYRSEPRKQQQSYIGQPVNNSTAVIKRVGNQQQQTLIINSVGGMTGVNGIQQMAQSDTQIQQQQQSILSQQQAILLHQSLDANGQLSTTQALQNNLISPRTKKIVMNSQEAASKNHLILKQTVQNPINGGGGGPAANNTQISLENKSLEHTLRNRKIILSSGLKRAEHSNGGDLAPTAARKQIIFPQSANNMNLGGPVVSTNITDL